MISPHLYTTEAACYHKDILQSGDLSRVMASTKMKWVPTLEWLSIQQPRATSKNPHLLPGSLKTGFSSLLKLFLLISHLWTWRHPFSWLAGHTDTHTTLEAQCSKSERHPCKPSFKCVLQTTEIWTSSLPLHQPQPKSPLQLNALTINSWTTYDQESTGWNCYFWIIKNNLHS